MMKCVLSLVFGFWRINVVAREADATTASRTTTPVTPGQYAHIQFVACEMRTDFDHTGSYFGDRNSTVDIERKMHIVKTLVESAHGNSSIDRNQDTLKVFVFPEFLFRGFVGSYELSYFLGGTDDVPTGIPHKLAALVNEPKYADWMFVFGSVVAHNPTPSDGTHEVYNAAIIQLGHSDLSDTTRRRVVFKRDISDEDFLKLDRRSDDMFLRREVRSAERARDEVFEAPAPPMNATEQEQEPHAVLRHVGVVSEGLFVFHGVTFGVEICSDHGLQRLKKEARNSTPNLAQVQIVTSAGSHIALESVIVPSSGLVFLCDGSRFARSRGMRWAHSQIPVTSIVEMPLSEAWEQALDGAFTTQGRIIDVDNAGSDIDAVHGNGPDIVIYGPQPIPHAQSSHGSQCTYREFACMDNTSVNATAPCIMSRQQCDGVDDCGDGSDELNCDIIMQERRRAECVLSPYYADYCDESDCPGFRCGNGKCIQKTLVCNGEPDCDDESDESECPSCQVGDSGCWCDTDLFCGPLRKCTVSKEDNTIKHCDCSDAAFKCANFDCIEKDFQCDGEDDCDDGSDEMGCGWTCASFRSCTSPGLQRDESKDGHVCEGLCDVTQCCTVQCRDIASGSLCYSCFYRDWAVCEANDGAGICSDGYCEQTCVTYGGEMCQFPFTYNGIQHDGCTNVYTDNAEDFWCLTGASANNEMTFGYCASRFCPVSSTLLAVDSYGRHRGFEDNGI